MPVLELPVTSSVLLTASCSNVSLPLSRAVSLLLGSPYVHTGLVR